MPKWSIPMIYVAAALVAAFALPRLDARPWTFDGTTYRP